MKVAFISGKDNSIDTSLIGGLSYNKIDVAAYKPSELHLAILKNRMQILKEYYGDNLNKSYSKSIVAIDNYINGRTDINSFSGDKVLETLTNNITYAKSISNNFLENRIEPILSKDFKFGITKTLPSVRNLEWINNYLITTGYAKGPFYVLSNTSYEEYIKTNLTGKHNQDFSGGIFKSEERRIDKMIEWAKDKFTSFMAFRSVMYDKWEPIGHHVLYEFIDSPLEPSIVQTKSLLHKQALDVTAKIAYMDRATLNAWTENGIMITNTKNNLQPYEAKETINILRSAKKVGIGVIDPVTVSLIVAIAGALTAAAKVIDSIKGTPEGDFIANAQGFGTTSFSPNENDFNTGSSNGLPGNTSDLNKYLPYVLGAGALYYFTQNK